jgi:hypothetical protein
LAEVCRESEAGDANEGSGEGEGEGMMTVKDALGANLCGGLKQGVFVGSDF